jgi:molybdopterin molybdotransferase
MDEFPTLGPDPLALGEQNVTVDAARAAIHGAIEPITQTEDVPLARAVGRIVGADVVSLIDVPSHDNSAMDGYAFDGANVDASADPGLRLIGSVLAGESYPAVLRPGECVRIMTGAVMPDGADTVVPVELAQVENDRIRFAKDAVRRGEHRRRRGEDLASGKPVLLAGRVLRSADVGLAASVGITTLTVMRRLRVAVFSTGNEVIEPGMPLAPNCIYDSNRYALIAALQRIGADAIDLGIVRDEPQALHAALERASAVADAIVTSGGVSAGDADFTREVVAGLGSVDFWKIAMRPGRPFAFGTLRGPDRPVWLFALPGNPVASLVTFYVFARDALLTIAGATPEPLPVLRARAVAPIRKRPGRTEFQRGYVHVGSDGVPEVRQAGSQSAGVLRSMHEANALVVVGHDRGSVAAGEFVDVWLFDGLT